MTRARTAVYTLNVTHNIPPVPQDLTGKKLIFTAKHNLNDPDAAAVFQKSSPASGISIDVGAGGTATLTVNPADTAALPVAADIRLVCDMVLIDGTNIYPLDSGTIEGRGERDGQCELTAWVLTYVLRAI